MVDQTGGDHLFGAAQVKLMMLDLGFKEPDDAYLTQLLEIFGRCDLDGSGKTAGTAFR